MSVKNAIILLACLVWLPKNAHAQQITLDNAIKIAQENSLDAKLAHFSFLARTVTVCEP